MKLAGKKILVTGGTGFVGSHLVKLLLKNKALVISTIQSQAPESYFQQQNLGAKVTLAPIDICQTSELTRILCKYEVDYLQPLVETAYFDPQSTYKTNIEGTISVLEAARAYPKLTGTIIASSDKAYGKKGEKKYLETDPLMGDHPYEASKAAADLIAQSYQKTYNLPVIITRFGNIYGEGDLNFSRLIPGIAKAVSTNSELILRSDGTFIRDYIYVGDVAAAYLLLLENFKAQTGQAFNFGSTDSLSVLQVIKKFEEALGQKISYKIIDQAKNEIPYQSLNFNKIKKAVAWQPKSLISNTAKQIINWYEDYFSTKI